MAQRVACPACGYENTAGRSTCKSCRAALTGAPGYVAPKPGAGTGAGKFLIGGIALLLVVAVASYIGGATGLVATPRAAWINGLVECPTSPEFGERVADSANLWSDTNMLRSLDEVPHGAQVQVFEEAGDFLEVGYRGQRGFVQSNLISDYDPAGGVQPNEDECL